MTLVNVEVGCLRSVFEDNVVSLVLTDPLVLLGYFALVVGVSLVGARAG